MNRPLITFTTDFGVRDPYAAAMKGAALARCPEATLLDLTHDIGARDILEAALFIAESAPYYPPDSIHVIVVDPGVGSERFPVVAAAGGRFFVCPDNGVLTLHLREYPLEAAHVIANPSFMRAKPSATFHGRDIFAPAAAALANGAALEEFGPRVDAPVLIVLPEPRTDEHGLIHGEVIRVDRFGNAITNIHNTLLQPAARYRVHAAAVSIPAVVRTYAEGAHGVPLALIGGAQRLEIALRDDSAATRLGIVPGDPVTVYPV
jgi:hypothetical protein